MIKAERDPSWLPQNIRWPRSGDHRLDFDGQAKIIEWEINIPDSVPELLENPKIFYFRIPLENQTTQQSLRSKSKIFFIICLHFAPKFVFSSIFLSFKSITWNFKLKGVDVYDHTKVFLWRTLSITIKYICCVHYHDLFPPEPLPHITWNNIMINQLS